MMFIVRTVGETAALPAAQIKARRKTPDIVPNATGRTDYFCVGTAEDISALRAGGLEVVELRDGWYADDTGGGIGISGHGKYWEIRDTPFTVRELVGPAGEPEPGEPGGTLVNVRGAIFGV
ncbi:MAG TPA: hypothetical protein VL985_20415 [Stellaceae bacterium]|nr:hypothetical protein [Stellaceae bacterium]